MDELVKRLEWFKAVILPQEAALKTRLRRLCPPGFDVENLVAESLARAYTAADIDRITYGRGYLFAIARNLLIDAARRDTIVSLDFVADLDNLRAADNTTEAAISARAELRWLQAFVDTLPPQCRRVFLLRRVHDLSLGEIAGEMALSVSTVEKHLAKAVMLLAKALAEREESGLERTTRDSGRTAGDRRRGLGVRR
ncbi:sigma-70 family RNA polymerase sigma factor [Phenylobacterium sp.]|uniref:RNA polymerase sigma factor n=1 Tax=Phenylobacterium sp. TaxID=1871053 RepID=UPI002C040F61|nr:sigma-70 family RNA polymerase sigma factor [Phenylobacterium sp.]HLZ74765.1 sigma-70 family RNA polymerase sigma factor [Phenylobacterium sp.]